MKLKEIINNYREDPWYISWARNKEYICEGIYVDPEASYPVESYFARYYLNKSGEKTLSTQILNEYEDVLNVHIKRFVVTEIRNKFENKWDRIWESIILNYKPQSPFNVDYKEKITDDLTSSTIRNGTEKTNSKGTDKTINSTEESVNAINSFNNGNVVPSDKSTTTLSDESQNTDNSESTTTNSENYTRQNPKTREYSRSGNIGNKSITQLLNEDIEFRRIQMWDIMCSDLDTIFTTSIYED